MVRRILMHAIDEIFHPLSPTDGPHHKKPMSVKKLEQDAQRHETKKVLLPMVKREQS